MPKGNPPVYWLKITDKRNTKQRTMAGVAFTSEFNQLRLVLNPGVRLDWNDDIWLTLEPIDPKNPPRLPATLRFDPPPDQGDTGGKGKGGGDDDSDIPF